MPLLMFLQCDTSLHVSHVVWDAGIILMLLGF